MKSLDSLLGGDTQRNERSIVEIQANVLEEAEAYEIKPEDRDGEGNLLVIPGGQKSNLSEHAWKVVRTEGFKAWFGDWQLASEQENEVSKIVDEHGEPLQVYHETNKDFDTFDDTRFGSTNDEGYYGAGHYFHIGNAAISGFYSGQEQVIMRGFLNIKHPYYFDDSNPEVLIYRHLLNRKPKEKALAGAREYIGIERQKQNLKDLESGIIQRHRDIPKGVDADEYWEAKRLETILSLKSRIEKEEAFLEELPRLYDELNTNFDGVITQGESGKISRVRAIEVVAFSGEQVLITEKEDNRSEKNSDGDG